MLYASEHAAAAVAERFAAFPDWSDLFTERHGPLGTVLALATLDLTGAVLDLDDARTLLARALRPSDVATRVRADTQAMALRAYEERLWVGLRWWSAHEARWGIHGVWDLPRLRVVNVEALTSTHPAFTEASEVLGRA